MCRWIKNRIENYITGLRASVTVEFVVGLPVLLAVLAFATQYGRAMQIRNALDTVTRDGARYISRAPEDDNDTINAVFFTNARAIITDRLEDNVDSITFNVMSASATLITVEVSIEVDFPLLEFLSFYSDEGASTTFTMTAREEWPRQ